MKANMLAPWWIFVALGVLMVGTADGQTPPATPAQPEPAAQQQAAPVEIPPLPPLPPVEQEAFKRVREEAAPLTPGQIRTMGRVIDDAERAAATPPRFVPKVVSSAVSISMQPGATPPVARLAANYVTTLVFMDQLGSPLRVKSVDLGSPKGFNMTWDQSSESGTNFVSLSPTSLYPSGNVSVVLEGVPVPVTLTLVTGQREVDDRVDVRVRGVVSGAIRVSGTLPQGISKTAQDMLGGVAPSGTTMLTTTRQDVQAWYVGQRFYVRAPAGATVLSPACIEIAHGPDGSTVCSIPPIPVVSLLVGRDQVNVMLSGY